MAVPNAALAWILGHLTEPSSSEQELADSAFSVWAGFTSVLFFVLSFRSNVAYNRWWEGGTLLQQTRGEWFNAYSSLIAFTSPDVKMQEQVEAYQHMLARLMSMLFCSALQQVSPNKERPFIILDFDGIDPQSLKFLRASSDRVEVIIQWIQRSTVLGMTHGVLPVAPPVMSRVFQEMSRGIVNLQNARKIADFPFPFPYAQTSIVMLIIHWFMCPVLATTLLNRNLAAITCFVVVFFMWCLNFIALQLEAPFGIEDNDLPMDQMQDDWNKSVASLLKSSAQTPPKFRFDPIVHRKILDLGSCCADLGSYRTGCRMSSETDDEMVKRRSESDGKIDPTGGTDSISGLPLGRSVSSESSSEAVPTATSYHIDPAGNHKGRAVTPLSERPLLGSGTSCGSSASPTASPTSPAGPSQKPGRQVVALAPANAAPTSASGVLAEELGRKARQATSDSKGAFARASDDLNGLSTGTAVSSTATAASSANTPGAGGLPKPAGRSETHSRGVDVEDISLQPSANAGGERSSGSQLQGDHQGCGAALAAAFSLFPASSSPHSPPGIALGRRSGSRQGTSSEARAAAPQSTPSPMH